MFKIKKINLDRFYIDFLEQTIISMFATFLLAMLLDIYGDMPSLSEVIIIFFLISIFIKLILLELRNQLKK